MAVCIYSEGKWQSLAGKKISKDGEWKSLGDFDKMKIGNSWHKLGFANTKTVDVPPVMQFRNGEEPTAGNKWYVTPNGSGDLSGSSWENAASSDTLRTVVVNAVSGDAIYFSGGDYNFTVTIDNPSGVNLYGGFALDNLSWENRNGFLHQTRITGKGFGTATFIDGFVLMNQESFLHTLKNCIVIECADIQIRETHENCLYRKCQIYPRDYAQSGNFVNFKDSFFSECEVEFIVEEDKVVGTHSYNYAYSLDCQFYKCYIQRISGSSEAWLLLSPTVGLSFVQCNIGGDLNAIPVSADIVDCKCSIINVSRGRVINSTADTSIGCSTACVINSTSPVIGGNSITCVNSDTTGSSPDYTNSVSWNSGVVFNSNTCASSDYSSNGIVLGNDNLITKFTNTGYYPARGVQDLGGCPCPFDDPDGYEAYVASFGDWHPLSDSVLVGRGGNVGGTDLDSVTRPDPATIGCYEPRPQETE